MSEAELHVLRARLRGGILNKASRAALKLPLPMGLAYAEDDTVILDPDAQIQQAVGLLFATFKRTGSATATVKYFRTKALLFPRRVRTGPHKGEVHWGPLLHSTTLKVLRNPRYAGAFYGIRLYPEYLCQKEQIEQAGTISVSRCLVRAWIRRSPICCWHN